MRKIFALLFLALTSARPAEGLSLQFELGGAGAAPFGSYADGRKAGDVFGLGGGAWGSVGLALPANLTAGLEVGAYLSRGSDFDAQFGAYDYKLWSMPAQLFGEYRRQAAKRKLGYFGRAGFGLTRHSLSLNLARSIAQKQTNPSLQLGAGLLYGLTDRLDLCLGLVYQQAFTSADCLTQGADEGPFCGGDHPKFLLFRIGARLHGNQP